MDVTTFYALFSATCFTLLGGWWTVVQRHEEWLRNAEQRAVVGGVYLSFLLPALMGLFAQVGGTETPAIAIEVATRSSGPARSSCARARSRCGRISRNRPECMRSAAVIATANALASCGRS